MLLLYTLSLRDDSCNITLLVLTNIDCLLLDMSIFLLL